MHHVGEVEELVELVAAEADPLEDFVGIVGAGAEGEGVEEVDAVLMMVGAGVVAVDAAVMMEVDAVDAAAAPMAGGEDMAGEGGVIKTLIQYFASEFLLWLMHLPL